MQRNFERFVFLVLVAVTERRDERSTRTDTNLVREYLPQKYQATYGNRLCLSIFGLTLQYVPIFIDAPEGYDIASIRSFYQIILSRAF